MNSNFYGGYLCIFNYSNSMVGHSTVLSENLHIDLRSVNGVEVCASVCLGCPPVICFSLSLLLCKDSETNFVGVYQLEMYLLVRFL